MKFLNSRGGHENNKLENIILKSEPYYMTEGDMTMMFSVINLINFIVLL